MSSAEDLKTIRKIMEESTRFLSLSGFSGVFMGLVAVAGAAIAHYLVLDKGSVLNNQYFSNIPDSERTVMIIKLLADALVVLVLSLSTAFWFSLRKGKKEGKSIWTPVAKRLMFSLMIPLATGAAFIVLMLARQEYGLIVPGFLIFYGLALVNAGKFTYNELFYLGVLEIITGLLSVLFPAQGILFWAIGFGILHIAYGLFMYRKYEA